MCLNREFGGAVRAVAVLVAVGVSADGFREILGVREGAKEDTESGRTFLRHLKGRGLRGVQLVISDKCWGLVEAAGAFFPQARGQRCAVPWYRNVFRVVPTGKVKEVAALLKAIHAQEDREAARAKAAQVVAKLEGLRLGQVAELVRAGAAETLAYRAFPREHWTRLRTNNPLERLNLEIKRGTRVVGTFPDGASALMLVAARLRYVAGTKWGGRRSLNTDLLRDEERPPAPAACAGCA